MTERETAPFRRRISGRDLDQISTLSSDPTSRSRNHRFLTAVCVLGLLAGCADLFFDISMYWRGHSNLAPEHVASRAMREDKNVEVRRAAGWRLLTRMKSLVREVSDAASAEEDADARRNLIIGLENICRELLFHIEKLKAETSPQHQTNQTPTQSRPSHSTSDPKPERTERQTGR